MDAEDQVKIDETMIDARRHAEQGAARRQRHPRRLARRRQGRRRRRRRCRSTAMSAARTARAAAGADDEHRQWRRACRQSDRLPGIHDHAGRRADASPRRCAWASEMFHTLKKALKDAGHNTNVGDEGGFAPNLPSAEAALDFVMKAIEKAGFKPGEDVVLGARLRRDRVLQGRRLSSMKARARRARSRSRPSISPSSPARYPIVSIEDGMAEDDWEGWKLLTDLDRRQVPARRRRPLRHQRRRASRDGIKRGRRQLDPRQGQPDRHADRDARRRRDGAPRRLHRGDVAPLGRDRGRDHRRPRGRDQLRADQDRLARALRPHWRNTTSSSASRRSSATQARYAGRGALKALRCRESERTP